MRSISQSSFVLGLSKLSKTVIEFVASQTFLYIILACFLLQSLYFVFVIKFGIPPDENYHFTYIQFFSEITPSPFPTEQHGYYILREAIHNPFFIYHYLLSLPYAAISHFDNSYIFLRLINVLFAFASLLTLLRISSLLKISPLARNLSVLMLVNTLMFTFLSSAINYDNLFILLSLLGILFLLELNKKITALNLLLFLTVLLLGVFTKINFLPIAFIVFSIFIFKNIKNRHNLIKDFKKTFSKSKKINVALVFLIVLLLGVFAQRYMYNVINYNKLTPSCPAVKQIEDCRKSALFSRNEMIYSGNRPGLKKNYLEYARDWISLIGERTFGVFGHKVLDPNVLIVGFFKAFLLFGGVSIIIYWRKISPELKIIILLVLFYSLIVFLVNIKNYHATGRFSFAVHGRYLFAVLPLIYLIGNSQIFSVLKKDYQKISYIFAVLIIFLVGNIPLFLLSIDPTWFR